MLSTAAPTAAPHLLDPEQASLHAEPVFRAALRLTRSTHDAEDLAQEAYARVLSRPRVIRNGDDLGYLLRAVRNTHFSAHRSAARRGCTVVEPGDLERIPQAGSDPHTTAEVHEVIADIAELPAPQRAVVTAVDLVGLSYAETAEALGVPIGTVMSRLSRARSALSR
jgi:RNA polymerase sigma-70 factor (ECF subfamily)